MKDPALASSSRLGGAVISDRVVASLLEELTNGRYAQADRLPAEVDLATELGVSRTVIRDALSEMERAGYVERVRGIEMCIRDRCSLPWSRCCRWRSRIRLLLCS